MTIIVSYFPLLTYIIVILGVTYFLYRKHWIEEKGSFQMKPVAILLVAISCSLLNGLLLTAPILNGSAFANSLPELTMWMWPDLLVVGLLGVDIMRRSGRLTPRE
jgi:hypothetical protein